VSVREASVSLIDWILIIVPILAGGIVLVRPGWVGYRHGFPGSTLLGFVLVSVGMTSPILLHLDELAVDPSGGEDALIGIWNLWWTKRALLQGSNPYFSEWLYHPSGTSLGLHGHAVTYGIASLPLQMVFAPGGGERLYAIYNLLLLASFSSTAYFTYRLALHESQHRAASILAGLIFAFCAFRFANTSRLHLMATELLVLASWASVRWMRRPSLPRLLALFGAGWLVVHASLEYAILALLVFGWIVLSRILPSRLQPEPVMLPDSKEGRRAVLREAFREPASPRRFPWMGWLALAAVVLGFVPWASQLLQRLSRGGTAVDPRYSDYYSADLLDLALPNPRHPVWGEPFARITADLHFGDPGFGAHLGIVALALFVFTFRHASRAHRGRRWAWGALFFVVLSLGSRLHLNGETIPVPLPHALLAHLPILGALRTPIHYLAAAQLFLAVAIAMGWAGRERSRRRDQMTQSDLSLRVSIPLPTRTEILLGGAVLLTSLAAPWTYTAVPVPRVYEIVRERAGRHASTLLHVPGLRARDDLLYQTVHGQRLVDDLSAAIPWNDGTEEGLRTQMWQTLSLGFAQPGFVAGLSEDQRNALRQLAREYFDAFDIRWVVVPSDPVHQSVGTADRIPEDLLGAAAYRAYRENLQQLRPEWETERDGFTLFEFR
jgi:hypothetical protein